MDFGLPVVPDGAVDVARFTALCVDRGSAPTTALTRIVPLRRLLRQRAWVAPDLLLERLRRYGEANAGDGAQAVAAHVEGIFARLVEAADGRRHCRAPAMPASCAAWSSSPCPRSRDHFATRGLDLDSVEEAGCSSEPASFCCSTTSRRRTAGWACAGPWSCISCASASGASTPAGQSLLLRRVLQAFEFLAGPYLLGGPTPAARGQASMPSAQRLLSDEDACPSTQCSRGDGTFCWPIGVMGMMQDPARIGGQAWTC